MSAPQIIFAIAVLSLPIVTLMVVARSALCMYRTHKAKARKYTLLSILGAVCVLGVFSVVVIAWLGYGVAHTQKDARTDLILLGATGIPIYVLAYGIWRMSKFFESRLVNDVT